MGKSPDNREPVGEIFHTAPCRWNGSALYATEHCTEKRRKGRIEMSIATSKVQSEPHQGGVLYGEENDGARASGKAQPRLILTASKLSWSS